MKLSLYLAASLLFVNLIPSTAYSLNYRTYTIGTYNIENFWDDDPLNTHEAWEEYLRNHPPPSGIPLPRHPQYDDYSQNNSNWHSKEVISQKIDQLIKAIHLANRPDIFAFQEIESAGNKSKFFNTHHKNGKTLKTMLKQLGYRYFLLGAQQAENPVSVTTAVISKVKVKSLAPVVVSFGNPSTSARDLQVVELKINQSERLVLFNGHWKSKRGKNSERQRVQIALELKERIQEERNKAEDLTSHIIVLGDLNTAYYELPLKELGATGDETEMLKASTNSLYNLWYELPVKDRWEHSFNGVKSTLSNILLSHTLYYDSGFRYEDHSYHVVGHQGEAKQHLISYAGQPFRWQIFKTYDMSFHQGVGFSDHLPLVAKFRYSKRHDFETKQHLVHPQEEMDIDTDGSNIPLILDEYEICNPDHTIKLGNLPIKLERGLCVEIDNPKGYDLIPRGKYRNDFIKVKIGSKQKFLGVSLTRRFDWRPNIDDSRVFMRDLHLEEGTYHARRPHPHSNQCYSRKVLSGRGGKLTKAIGRLEYQDGALFIQVPSREQQYLELKDLPPNKKSACRWSI